MFTLNFVLPALEPIYSTAELFTMCCPRKLLKLEMDPSNKAVIGKDGKSDTLGVFAESDLIRALQGHPACVQDLCHFVHDERSLFLRNKELLETILPRVRAKALSHGYQIVVEYIF